MGGGKRGAGGLMHWGECRVRSSKTGRSRFRGMRNHSGRAPEVKSGRTMSLGEPNSTPYRPRLGWLPGSPPDGPLSPWKTGLGALRWPRSRCLAPRLPIRRVLRSVPATPSPRAPCQPKSGPDLWRFPADPAPGRDPPQAARRNKLADARETVHGPGCRGVLRPHRMALQNGETTSVMIGARVEFPCLLFSESWGQISGCESGNYARPQRS